MTARFTRASVAAAACGALLAATMCGCTAAQQAVYGDSAASKASVVLADAMGKDVESIAVKAAGSADDYQQLNVDQVIWANGDDAQLELPFEGKVDVLVCCTDGSSFELHDVDVPAMGGDIELCYDFDLDTAYLSYTAADGSKVTTLAAEQELVAARETQAAKEKADQKAAAKVIAKISDIGKVTLGKEKAIAAAKKAYGKLSKEQKKLVDNYKDLEKAQKRLKTLKKEKKEAEAKAAAEAAAAAQSSSSYSSGSSYSGSSSSSSSGGSSSGSSHSSGSSGSHSSGGSSSGGSSSGGSSHGGSSGGSSSGGSSGGSDSGSDTPACDPDAF